MRDMCAMMRDTCAIPIISLTLRRMRCSGRNDLLVGYDVPVERSLSTRGWDRAFDHLAEKCAYLIHVRGYEAWAI